MTMDEMEQITLSRRGKLYSYSLIQGGAPAGFQVPYAVGYVDLPEGIRLFCQLVDCEPYDEILQFGIDVEMIVGRITGDEFGNDLMGYQFRPVRKEGEGK